MLQCWTVIFDCTPLTGTTLTMYILLRGYGVLNKTLMVRTQVMMVSRGTVASTPSICFHADRRMNGSFAPFCYFGTQSNSESGGFFKQVYIFD